MVTRARKCALNVRPAAAAYARGHSRPKCLAAGAISRLSYGAATMKGIFIATLAVVLCASNGNAHIPLKKYRDYPNYRDAYRLYLNGVKEGLLAFNTKIESDGKDPYFCLPNKLALTTDKAEDIMLRTANKRRLRDDTPVASVLLYGLIDTFPCRRSNK
jgi:hypothetical protein